LRLLWLSQVGWERATEAEAAVMVGWLRSAKIRSQPAAETVRHELRHHCIANLRQGSGRQVV